MKKEACGLYILSNARITVLYTGATTNLVRRVWEHKQGLVDGFAKRYNCRRLVYYELHEEWASARARENQIKGWRREWKNNLIRRKNPEWKDLYSEILG